MRPEPCLRNRLAVYRAEPAFMLQASRLRRRYPDRGAGLLSMTQYPCLRRRTVDHEQRRGVQDESE
jgi:hypothetical protein